MTRIIILSAIQMVILIILLHDLFFLSIFQISPAANRGGVISRGAKINVTPTGVAKANPAPRPGQINRGNVAILLIANL